MKNGVTGNFISLVVSVCISAVALFATEPPADAQQNPIGLTLPGTSSVTDVTAPLSPSQIHVGGLVGKRFDLSEKSRLLKVDESELLAGFRSRPGKHPWIGEHVGKWLHAATLTWACTKSPELRAKMDRVVSELLKAQDADGYLGTYSPATRFRLDCEDDWDVWTHKYVLIGLLTYYQYTGDPRSLSACRRIGNLLIRTFGPGKKSIVSCGTMVGMASTSVLEPMTLLYRATGDERYLRFAEYIVESWEEQSGPHLLSSLLNGTPVYKIGNGKSYEMISDMVGLCELYRTTGNREYLDAVLNGWKDIREKRLYITGSGSSVELWRPDGVLPNDPASSVCETCVTVTWMQLNAQLLRLTGESKYSEELERSLFNHLLAAQKPTGDDWCYYTPLEGRKHFYSDTLCCHSSGPRGIAFAPGFFYTYGPDVVSVNVFSPSTSEMPLHSGRVKLVQETRYPLDGVVRITVLPERPYHRFTVKIRIPSWAFEVTAAVNGKQIRTRKENGFLVIRRRWKAGDIVAYSMRLEPRVTIDDQGNTGCMAMTYGPLVLAAAGPDAEKVGPATTDPTRVNLSIADRDGIPSFGIDGFLYPEKDRTPSPCRIDLVPFYAAGGDGSPFRVWMKSPY